MRPMFDLDSWNAPTASSARRCRRRRRMLAAFAERLGTTVVVKHENHTPTGAFKVRGGLVYLDRLKRERPGTAGLSRRRTAITARASLSRRAVTACR